MTKKLLLALVFSLASGIASAASVTKSWSVEVMSGMFAGEVGSGTFTYDDSLISNSGEEYINALDGLTLTLNFLGQNFTELNDFEYNLFPSLVFSNGSIVSLDYFVNSGINNNNALDFGTSVLTLNGSVYTGEINVTAVPEPEAYAMMLAGLGLIAFVARRRKPMN